MPKTKRHEEYQYLDLLKDILKNGTKKHTTVSAIDEPGCGGANHSYLIMPTKRLIEMGEKGEKGEIAGSCCVNFQKGPIKEAGVNGIMNEDLIAIVIDRMQGFQSGDYACRDNELALTKLEEALMWLRNRTNDRELRGVEGTNVI